MNIKYLALAGALLCAVPTQGLAVQPVIVDDTVVNKGTGVPNGQIYSNVFSILTAGLFRLDVSAWGSNKDATGSVTANVIDSTNKVIDFVTVNVSGKTRTSAFEDFVLAVGNYRIMWTGSLTNTDKGKAALHAEASLVARPANQTVPVPGPEAGAGLGALAMAGLAYAVQRRKKTRPAA